jgi:cysteine desulfurase/selenocysteine lyase
MNTSGTEVATAAGSRPPREFNVWRIREDFPVLRQTVHGKPLVYLDNAATTQKPRAVIAALEHFYTADCSNVHRGVHLLSERATAAYEEARRKVQRFLNAASEREIIFVRGTTEAINLVAHSFGRPRLAPGDEVLLTHMEHHSNIVPWQLLCQEKGARLRVAPIDDRGELIFEEFERLLGPRTRIVAVAHVSNALGTVNPVRRIIEAAHARGVPVVVDGAQAAAHIPLDVQALDCDFYAFSGHKLYAPNGIGVLYGKAAWLEQMPPYQSGGDMIRTVTFEKTTFNELPWKFEAGTPNIAGAIGLGAAIDYLNALGLENAAAWEQELLAYATGRVASLPGVRLIGAAREKAAVLSFVVEGVHPHDVATILDRQGVAVRAGHVCAQPVMERFGVPAITRASFAFYNTREEVDALVEALHKVREIFG